MKAVALLLGLTATSSANIIFTHTELTCYNTTELYNGNGCLRGQDCNSNNQLVLEIFVKASLADQTAAAYQLKSDG
jgi:hypothetical protein